MRPLALALIVALSGSAAVAQPSGVDVGGSVRQTTSASIVSAVNLASPGAKAAVHIGVIFAGASIQGSLTQSASVSGVATAANIASVGAAANVDVGVIGPGVRVGGSVTQSARVSGSATALNLANPFGRSSTNVGVLGAAR